jgi:hypothetical protein
MAELRLQNGAAPPAAFASSVLTPQRHPATKRQAHLFLIAALFIAAWEQLRRSRADPVAERADMNSAPWNRRPAFKLGSYGTLPWR